MSNFIRLSPTTTMNAEQALQSALLDAELKHLADVLIMGYDADGPGYGMSIKDNPLATSEDLAEIDRLIAPQKPPERIYGWMDSHMSIARHYGGFKYMGHDYQIAYLEPKQPLIRVDVLKREIKSVKESRAKVIKLLAENSKQSRGA